MNGDSRVREFERLRIHERKRAAIGCLQEAPESLQRIGGRELWPPPSFRCVPEEADAPVGERVAGSPVILDPALGVDLPDAGGPKRELRRQHYAEAPHPCRCLHLALDNGWLIGYDSPTRRESASQLPYLL